MGKQRTAFRSLQILVLVGLVSGAAAPTTLDDRRPSRQAVVVAARQVINEKVEFSIFIAARPERAYDALASAEGLDAWFTKGASVDARSGGSIEFRWKGWGYERYAGEDGGPVLEASRPERFVFQWKVDGGTYYTTVEIDFQKVPDGTLVSLTEHGYEDSSTGLKDMLQRASGWAHVLTLMKFHLEGRVGR